MRLKQHAFSPFRLWLNLWLVMVLLVGAFPTGAWPAGRAAAASLPPDRRDLQACELLVKLRPGVEPQAALDWLQTAAGLQPLGRIPRLDIWRVSCAAEIGQATALARLAGEAAQQRLLWAEPNLWLQAAVPAAAAGSADAVEVTPNDSLYAAQQDNLRQIGLPLAWEITTGASAPIAIVDTAIALDHNDLKAKIWTNLDEIADNGLDDDGNGYIDDLHGWDFYAGDANPNIDPSGDSSHGTEVAGVAAAESNNALGIAGIAWQNPIMALRVLGRDEAGPIDAVAAAVVYAADNGARVINMSLGGVLQGDPPATMEAAIAYARAKGCLLVAAAGNSASVLYPASSPGVLAIGSVDSLDSVSDFSAAGPELDLMAPGEAIISTGIGGYFLSSGTSLAAPHISGTAALVWAVRPQWTPDQVTYVLTDTAKDLWMPGWDSYSGWGRVQAGAAVLAADQTTAYNLYFPLAGVPGAAQTAISEP